MLQESGFVTLTVFAPVLQQAAVCDMVCFFFEFSIEEHFAECSWADLQFYRDILVHFSMLFLINLTPKCEVRLCVFQFVFIHKVHYLWCCTLFVDRYNAA